MNFKISDIPGAIAGCFEKITAGRVRSSKQTACGGIGSAGSNGPSLVQHNGKAHNVQEIINSANSKEGSRVSKCLTTITTIISKIPILGKLIHKKATNSHNVVNENGSKSTGIEARSSDSKETKSATFIPPGGYGAQREAVRNLGSVIEELKSKTQKKPEAPVSKEPEEVSANHDPSVPVDEQRPSADSESLTKDVRINLDSVIEELKSKAGTIPEDTTISSEPSVDTKSDVQETTQKQGTTGAETVGSSSVDVSKLKKGSKEELGEKYSRAYSGESIVTKHGEFEFECIPQYQLSGFSDGNGTKYTYTDNSGERQDYKLYSSNFGSKDHVSDLWGQNISGPNGKISFIRSGCSRGNDQAAKELCLNAAIMQKGGKEVFDLLIKTNKGAPIPLKLSNIQLMTPGKLGDGDIPWKQMQRLWDFSRERKEPITVPYTTGDGQTVNVKIKLEEPLLFNFGVNFQHFKFGFFASSKDIDKQNAESFRKLFGVNPSELSSSVPCIENSILGEFLADSKKTETEKGRAIALATQIINILKKHPRGIESNPYALPVRVMLLTSLIGYATTYGCKSGKDRTGVCSLELEALATKLLSGGELYDPEKTTDEEQAILKQLYLQGEANKIAKANTGQKGLKIQEALGFTSLSKRFDFNLADDFVDQSESQEINKVTDKQIKSAVKDVLNDLNVKISNLMKQKDKLEDIKQQKDKLEDIEQQINEVEDIEQQIKKLTDKSIYGNDAIDTDLAIALLENIRVLSRDKVIESFRGNITKLISKGSIASKEMDKIQSEFFSLIFKELINPLEINEISAELGELKNRLESIGLQKESSGTVNPEIGNFRHKITELIGKGSITSKEMEGLQNEFFSLIAKELINPLEMEEILTELRELKNQLESVGLQNGSSDTDEGKVEGLGNGHPESAVEQSLQNESSDTDKGEVGGLGDSHPESAVEQSDRFEVNLADDFGDQSRSQELFQSESKKVFGEIDETIDDQLEFYDKKVQDGLKDLKSKISNLMNQKSINLDDINDIEKQISDLAGGEDDIEFAGEFITKLEVIKALINNPQFGNIIGRISNLMGKDSITPKEVKEIQEEFIFLRHNDSINPTEIEEILTKLKGLKNRLESVGLQAVNPEAENIIERISNLMGKDSITPKEVKEIQREFLSLGSNDFINPKEINEISTALGELKKRL